jgi:glycosyltransferase involved in cell wall biosynthesis
MNTVLAHDSFTQRGGAERVVEALHELYPRAEVYTLVRDKKYRGNLNGWKIKISALQALYSIWPHFKHFLFFLRSGVKSLHLPENSIILSSSSLFMKGLAIPANSIHVNYCHTPVRFLWSEPEYINQEVPGLLRPLVRWYLQRLRSWDKASAKKVDYFLANSREVQKRIKQYYGRDSEIIYPGIDTDFWQPIKPKENYFLIAGRLQAHKSSDVVIEAFNELGIELHVVGKGDDEARLKNMSKMNIKFLGFLGDEQLRDQYSGALGLIYPQLEDFGLTPVEAAACGTATLGLAQGGSLETVIPGQTGELLPHMDKEPIKQAVRSWQVSKYHTATLQAHAANFSKKSFQLRVKGFIGQVERSRP